MLNCYGLLINGRVGMVEEQWECGSGSIWKAFNELFFVFLHCLCRKLTVCFKKSTLPLMLNLANTKISIMSYSHSEDNQSRQDELDPQDFIDRPMIILSSNSEPQLPDVQTIQHTASATDAHQLMLIERKKESEQERLKKLNSIKSIWNEQEQREKREREDIRKNPPKKANLQQVKAKEAELHNMFSGHRYLPISVLESAREKLQDFKSHPKCQFQKGTKHTEQQIGIRQGNRETLTKYVILACEELRLREDKTKKQKKLFENNLDLLAYSYRVAAEIQENFFKKLYRKSIKIGQAYNQQLKLIYQQFRDKNNLAFRRKIINKEFDLHELANASEDSLTCEKTKREEEEKRKQLIRENEKIAPESPIDLEDDIIEIPAMESIRSYESIKSRSDILEQRPQDLKRRREKQQQIRKNKKICKETHQTLSKHFKEMKERTQRLRAHQTLRIPAELTFSFL